MKGLLISFFHSNNIGDVVLSNSLYELVKSVCQVDKISFGSNPFSYSDLNTFKVRKLPFIKRVYSYIFKKLKGLGIKTILQLLENVMRKKKNISIGEMIEPNVVAADFIIIGGGNMVFSLHKDDWSTIQYISQYIQLSTNYDKPVFLCCIGIGPFASNEQEKAAVKLIHKANYITFRDKSSFDLYRKYYPNCEKSFISADPAFLLPYRMKKCTEIRESKTIGINLVNYKLLYLPKRTEKEIQRGYLKLVEAIANRYSVVLFSTDMADYAMLNNISKAVINNNLQIRQISGLEDLLEFYNSIDLLVGSRMHSLLIAYTQAKPLVGIVWQQKVSAFFNIIQQPKHVFMLKELDSMIPEILECIDECFIDSDSMEKSALTHIEVIRELLDMNKSILYKMINADK